MQIIQNIREKGAAIVIVVIALCLISFILMDSKTGNSSLFGCNEQTTEIGKVNGKKIERSEFEKAVAAIEDIQTQRTGQKPSGIQTYQVREQAWNKIVNETILNEETQKLGIDVTDKELSYILTSNSPLNPLAQEPSLRDSITGKLDVKKAQDALQQIKKLKGEQKDNWNSTYIEPLKLNATVQKYSSLISSSVYYPKWMSEQDQKDSTTFANITYTTIPYSEISDSLVKVTDEDIQKYIDENKKMFKQEEGRKISYVAFSKLPNKEDSLKIFNELSALVEPFKIDTASKSFVLKNLSNIEFRDDYYPKQKLSSRYADTLSSLAAGAVFGPYADAGNYIVAKKIGSRVQPDSVKARHILIPINDPQTGQPINTDAAAKKIADSLFDLITKGANFDTLAKQNSIDQSNKDKGGDLGTFAYGTMVPEFNEFCFKQIGPAKGVVKTQFGYHIIDVQQTINLNPAYKIAYLSREISPSESTINKAQVSAIKAANTKTRKALDKYVSENGLSITSGPSLVKENDFQLGALQDARGLIRWAFEAKVGDVSETPFNIGDQIVVAVVDNIYEEGTQDVKTARPGCEAIIKNKKKAELIKKKLGDNPTFETISRLYGKSVLTIGLDSTIRMSSQIINGIGIEPKVIGASFNKAYQSKLSPIIEGTTGVFLVKVNAVQNINITPSPEEINNNVQAKLMAMKNQSNNWFEGLRKQAVIKDKRSRFY